MSTIQTMSVAEVAAKLADNPAIAADVEKQVADSRVVMMLIRMRIDGKLSQKEISEQMGCSPSRVSKLESGTDADLKWSDIMGYLRATKTSMSILLDNSRATKEMGAAIRIKQHVFEIDALLRELVTLASGDVGKEIVDKIHQFSGEVLMNFLRLFGNNYEDLRTIVNMYSNELPTAEQATKPALAEGPQCANPQHALQ